MKKTMRFYVICWTIFLAVFNAVVVLVRPVIPGFDVVYDVRFWVAWAFVILAFVGNLLCAKKAFAAENAQKLFYNISLIRISYTGLIFMLLFGAGLMLIPALPVWIAAVVCVLVLACSAIAVAKAAAAVELVEKVDEKVKTQTSFIRETTAEAEKCVNLARSAAVKAECSRIYEALRFSDPMSNPALTPEETQISARMAELTAAVTADDAEKAAAAAKAVVSLVGERNAKCKLLK